jgi:hypothetical protein
MDFTFPWRFPRTGKLVHGRHHGPVEVRQGAVQVEESHGLGFARIHVSPDPSSGNR